MNILHTIPRFAAPYGAADYFSALCSLASPEPPPPAGFAQLLGDRPMLWTSSGRQALCLILRAMNLPAGSGVAVPLYSDPSVHDAITAAGLRPVFVDVDPRTLTIDVDGLTRVLDRVAAIVVVHFFGHVAPVDRVLELARGIPVIEDTAHAPLSYLGNRMVGAFGAACFYSFASTKYWPAGGGGLAVINDQALAARVHELAAKLTPAGRLLEIRNATTQFAKALVFRRPLYGLLARPVRTRAERMGVLEPTLSARAILRSQAAVALRHVPGFPARVERHRANSLTLLKYLSELPDIVLPIERPGVRYNYYLFPVLLADREERDAVAQAMLRRHIDTSRIYYDVVQRTRRNGYQGGCPLAEAAADRMLTLPNHAGLSPADIRCVAAMFAECLRKRRAIRRPAGVPVGVSQVKQGVTA